MKTKIFGLVLLTTILSFSLISAVVDFVPSNIIKSVQPNSDLPVSFTIEAKSFSGQFENSSIILPKIFGDSTQWVGDNSNFTLLPNSNVTKNFILKIPSNQLAGVYNAKIKFKGDYNLSGSVTIKDLNLTVSVNPVVKLDSTKKDLTKKQNGTMTITNNGNTVISNLKFEITDGSDDFTPKLNDTSIFSLNPGESRSVLIYAEDIDNLDLGSDNSISVTASNGTISTKQDFEVPVSYCKNGEIGDLNIERIKFTNNMLGDKNDWYLTDEINVEVRVKNTGDEDLENIIVAWGLYDKKNKEFIVEDEEPDFDLDSKDRETITFKVKLDPADFDSDYSENDFEFYVKAYSDDSGEDLQCKAKSEDIKIKKDKHLVILDNIKLASDTIPCSSDIDLTANAWNIGSHDEDDVYVLAYNKELGINEKIPVGSLDVLDDKRINFNTLIPKNATEKSYTLELRVYDDNGDIFKTKKDEESIYYKTFKVEGNCKIEKKSGVRINAELDPETPEAIAGKQIIVRATLENTGESETTYTISTEGSKGWASLAAIDPQTVTIKPGSSKEVSIYLNINDNIEGEKEFTIKADYNGKEETQKVELSVVKPELKSSRIIDYVKKNWIIYSIILVNILLIIAIILVIKRMSVKPL